VIHGIEPAEDGGRIDVVVAQQGDDLTITVRDDGVGLSTSSGGHQVGLRNIRERLRSLYGAGASLTLEDVQPHGFMARLHLPGRS
jgi:sensor histidine kinase YesM